MVQPTSLTPQQARNGRASLTPAQQAWQQAVAKAIVHTKATLPQGNGRLDNAVQLVLSGAVTLLPDGTATVTSQQDSRITYQVTQDTCTCPDFPTAPDGVCKHRMARVLAIKATALAPQPMPAPSAPTPAMRPARHQARPSEQVIADAVAQAEQVCQAALEATPPAYQGFLMLLPRNKKVGGSKANPLYASIREPYLGVDGRVKMAVDAHRAQGASLVIQTAFELESHSGQLLCRATVTSALLGSFTAHARVFLGGSGVDASNPLENAETSAVGRALGFAGYGLYGTGIASAEEVLQAQAVHQDMPDAAEAAAPLEAGPSRPGGKPPTAKQQALLTDLLRDTGVPEEAIPGHLAQVTTSREASVRIDQLRHQRRQQAG